MKRQPFAAFQIIFRFNDPIEGVRRPHPLPPRI
jgi:hypothetical protein